MPSSTVSPKIAVAGISMIDVLILAIGYFILQQILLSVYIAVLASLIGGLLYVAWQYVATSDG